MEFPSATVFDQPKGKAEKGEGWGWGGGKTAAAVAMVTSSSHQWLFGLMAY